MEENIHQIKFAYNFVRACTRVRPQECTFRRLPHKLVQAKLSENCLYALVHAYTARTRLRISSYKVRTRLRQAQATTHGELHVHACARVQDLYKARTSCVQALRTSSPYKLVEGFAFHNIQCVYIYIQREKGMHHCCIIRKYSKP